VLKSAKTALFLLLLILSVLYSCEHFRYSTVPIPDDSLNTAEPDPNFDVTLDYYFQDYSSFIFLGNRAEAFGTYFNKFFTATEDYEEALKEFKTTAIAFYNRRLDSLNVLPPIQQGTKEKFTKVIERCSKIIQYNKSTKYFDRAIVLIGKSYFYSQDYIQSERKFTEFLSRLSKSEQADEALLFLGLTKFRLRRYQEGENILKNLLSRNVDNEIKSQAYIELASYAFMQRRLTDVENYFIQSIELTKDNDLKAERQFLLAKMYMYNNKTELAPPLYEAAFKNTSDFDLEFYAKLNEAKSYIHLKNFGKAEEILDKLHKDYLDYPDLLQLVELEEGNLLYSRNLFADARKKYFDIIVKYSGSKAAAESYYNLGVYYESEKSDYLKALISYRKAIETNSMIDYAGLCTRKTQVLDRYFELQAIINDTVKIEIPAEEKELDNFKKQYEEEKNKDLKRENPNKEFGNPKGGGFIYRDTIPENEDSLMKAFEQILQQKKQQEEKIPGMEKQLDTLPNDEKNVNVKGKDTIAEQKELIPVVNEDSLRHSKEMTKIGAYFELSEIFFYDLNRKDSSVYYLNKIISEYSDADWLSRATFYLASIYKSSGDETKADEYYREVISKYPNSVFAKESRKILSIESVEQVYDAADSLLNEAQKYLVSGENAKIPPLLYEAAYKYPQSIYYPRVILSLGWIYENLYPNKDSVYKYYSILTKEYPNTEFAKSISDKKAFLDSQFNKDTSKTAALNDSTGGTRDTLKINKDSLNNGEVAPLTVQDSMTVKQGELPNREEINQQGENQQQEINQQEQNENIIQEKEQNEEIKKEEGTEEVKMKQQ
jgi:tetratricopeptide (TPR) repeat protein